MVSVERTINGLSVVRELLPGQTIVTDGQLRLTPGAKVQAKETIEVKSQY